MVRTSQWVRYSSGLLYWTGTEKELKRKVVPWFNIWWIDGWLRFHADAMQRGLQTHSVHCRALLRPPQGPDVRLPKMLTLRWGDAAARAVIGLLTKTRRRTNTGSLMRWGVYVVLGLRWRGTIISPLVTTKLHIALCWAQVHSNAWLLELQEGGDMGGDLGREHS